MVGTKKILFCDPQVIESRLRQALLYCSSESLHPIEQAAHLWLDLVRIHPFNGAHKRTGKALASFILSKHGYLPPLITEKDLESYTKILIDSLDPKTGYERFTQFVARLVKRTQLQCTPV